MSAEERRARAAQRQAHPDSVPIRAFRLGDEPLVDARDTSTVDERLAEVLRLSYEAHRISGKPWPSYARSEMPGRVIRR
jgi:hypothetical protein